MLDAGGPNDIGPLEARELLDSPGAPPSLHAAVRRGE
jgi:hypothetical protein